MTEPTMTPDRWSQIQEIIGRVLEKESEERAAFLTGLCGDDSALEAEVHSLLDALERDGPIGASYDAQSAALAQLREALEGRYDIKEEVGAGGMATVYRAHDLKHNREVAIKVLRPDLSATIGADRFLREIEIAAGLQHPHILPLYDSGAAGNVLYYVMPFAEGDTLYMRLMGGRKLPAREAVQIASDVLSALEYAHRRGVIHRDIKPANILISSTGGHAMVADFGIARAVSAAEKETLTVPGAMIGTPGYMAPEQAMGGVITPATDIYAAGVVLYECLTGRRWMMAERSQDADWSGVPPTMLAALKRALVWSPRARWSEATKFRQALLGVEPRARAWSARVALAAVVVVAALVFGAVRWSPWNGARVTSDAVRRVVVLPFSVLGGAEFVYLGDGVVDLLSTKLDGAGTWRSVDPRAVLSAVAREKPTRPIDPATGRDIAERLGATLYVLGNVLEVGGQLRLNASLYDRERGRDAVAQASVEGPVAGALALLDNLATELLAAQPAAADARLTGIALVTSESLPAVKAYLRGVGRLRAAEYPAAAAAFQEAVGADSTFALAWYQLGVSADWLLQDELSRHATERALAFADRLAVRDRRLLEARGAVRNADIEDAEQLYRGIIGTYPDDVEAWSQLGELLSHWGPPRGRSIDDAREPWLRLLELEPDLPSGLVHLARIDAARRDFVALDSAARRVIELVPAGDRALEMRVLRAFALGDELQQARVLASAQLASDDLLAETLWSAGTYLGRPAAVALGRIMANESRSSDTRVLGFASIAAGEMASGRWTGALRALDAMQALNPVVALEYRAMFAATSVVPIGEVTLRRYRDQLGQIDGATVPPSTAPGVWYTAMDGVHDVLALYLAGLISAAVGDDARALAAARELAAMPAPDGSGSLTRDWARGVRATVALRAARATDAVAELEDFENRVWYQLASGSLFHTLAYERYVKAQALEDAGRFADALRWYGSFDHAGLWELVFLAPSHWRRGQIYERLGDVENARSHYRAFLALWSDVDQEFRPMVDEAKGRLARLGG